MVLGAIQLGSKDSMCAFQVLYVMDSKVLIVENLTGRQNRVMGESAREADAAEVVNIYEVARPRIGRKTAGIDWPWSTQLAPISGTSSIAVSLMR